jgi:hypothetical protein
MFSVQFSIATNNTWSEVARCILRATDRQLFLLSGAMDAVRIPAHGYARYNKTICVHKSLAIIPFTTSTPE